jgi:hypothetical protein
MSIFPFLKFTFNEWQVGNIMRVINNLRKYLLDLGTKARKIESVLTITATVPQGALKVKTCFDPSIALCIIKCSTTTRPGDPKTRP